MQEFFIGVDSHRSTLAAAAIDPIGRVLQVAEFDNDPKGHRRLLSWRQRLEGEVRIGIESSGNYGNGLARVLVAADEDVFEVPSNLSPARPRDRAGESPIPSMPWPSPAWWPVRRPCHALGSTRPTRASSS